MKLDRFVVDNGDLVGFGTAPSGRGYAVHFDIKVWREEWEKNGLTLDDFRNGRAEVITCTRNIHNGKPDYF